jgi:ribosomal protein S3
VRIVLSANWSQADCRSWHIEVDIERFRPTRFGSCSFGQAGIIIRRKGATVNQLRNDLQQLTNNASSSTSWKSSDRDRRFLVALSIAEQLQRRVSHKRQ